MTTAERSRVDRLYHNDPPDRAELDAMNESGVTLNGFPARIEYASADLFPSPLHGPGERGRFATVRKHSPVYNGLSGESAEWCWSTVRRVIAESGGRFRVRA